MTSELLIIGASARSAAASARRAGVVPWCADLFADSDLRAIAPVRRVPFEDYPSGFVAALSAAPQTPWLYCGGLENYPALIRQLAGIRPLFGNGPDALTACRSPFRVFDMLRAAGLPALRVSNRIDVDSSCRWIRKPLASSAGQGITFSVSDFDTRRHYLQEYVEGRSMSAVFARARGGVRLFGVTEQLIGVDWLHAPPFRYAGNIGPLAIANSIQSELVRIGQTIGEACGLLGLFGIDFILADGRPWLVEVNPRYVASIEVLELSTGQALLRDHLAAFDESIVVTTSVTATEKLLAKGIVYAPTALVIPPWTRFDKSIRLADVPAAGERIATGWPIATVIVEGSTADDCRRELRTAAARLLAHVLGR